MSEMPPVAMAVALTAASALKEHEASYKKVVKAEDWLDEFWDVGMPSATRREVAAAKAAVAFIEAMKEIAQ